MSEPKPKVSQHLYRPLEEFSPTEQQRLKTTQVSCPTCGLPAKLRGVVWGHNGAVLSCSTCGEFVDRQVALPIKSPRRKDGRPLTVTLSAAFSALVGLALVTIWYQAWRAELSPWVWVVLGVGVLFLTQAVGLWTYRKWAYYLTLVTFALFLPPIGWFMAFGYLQQSDIRQRFGLRAKEKGILDY